jgi:hypothetical protein
MDTAEMYERGVADAYRGVPNPTYYHQYEPYRLAYDQTRVRMRKTGTVPVIDVRRVGLNLLFVVAVLIILIGMYYFTTTSIFVAPKVRATMVILPTLPASQRLAYATNTPLPPTPEPLALKKGAHAVIQNTNGNPLRVRVSPSMSAKVAAYMRDNEAVQVLEEPILADGFVWWQISGISGSGWSAEHNNKGVVWIIPVP